MTTPAPAPATNGKPVTVKTENGINAGSEVDSMFEDLEEKVEVEEESKPQVAGLKKGGSWDPEGEYHICFHDQWEELKD